MKLKKRVKELERKTGAVITATVKPSGHVKLVINGTSIVNTAMSPSDHRAQLNILADIRREMEKKGQARMPAL